MKGTMSLLHGDNEKAILEFKGSSDDLTSFFSNDILGVALQEKKLSIYMQNSVIWLIHCQLEKDARLFYTFIRDEVLLGKETSGKETSDEESRTVS